MACWFFNFVVTKGLPIDFLEHLMNLLLGYFYLWPLSEISIISDRGGFPLSSQWTCWEKWEASGCSLQDLTIWCSAPPVVLSLVCLASRLNNSGSGLRPRNTRAQVTPRSESSVLFPARTWRKRPVSPGSGRLCVGPARLRWCSPRCSRFYAAPFCRHLGAPAALPHNHYFNLKPPLFPQPPSRSSWHSGFLAFGLDIEGKSGKTQAGQRGERTRLNFCCCVFKHGFQKLIARKSRMSLPTT